MSLTIGVIIVSFLCILHMFWLVIQSSSAVYALILITTTIRIWPSEMPPYRLPRAAVPKPVCGLSIFSLPKPGEYMNCTQGDT